MSCVITEVHQNNFDKMCRLCFRQDMKLESIFNENRHLTLNSVAQLTVQSGDCFPSKVCTICISNIQIVEQFVQKCKETEAILRQVAEKSQSEDALTGKKFDEGEMCHSEEVAEDCDMEDLPANDLDDSAVVFDHCYTKPLESIEPSKHKPNNWNKICQTCGEEVTSLVVHYKQKYSCKPKRFKCQYCNNWSSNNDTLTNHYRAHHPEKLLLDQFMCHFCSKVFKYKHSLNRHVLVHEKPHQFICDQCGKGFSANFNLATHQKKCKSPYYCCGTCKIKFPSNEVLQKHQKRRKHQNYTCGECDDVLEDKLSLKLHLLEHGIGTEENYVCADCSQEFYFKVDLEEHVEREHDTFLSCPLCSKRYKTSLALKTHMLRHTKTFVCPYCSDRFQGQALLKKHVSFKHKAKKRTLFSCHVCGDDFRCSRSRENHLFKAHGGDEALVIEVLEGTLENK